MPSPNQLLTQAISRRRLCGNESRGPAFIEAKTQGVASPITQGLIEMRVRTAIEQSSPLDGKRSGLVRRFRIRKEINTQIQKEIPFMSQTETVSQYNDKFNEALQDVGRWLSCAWWS